MIRGNSAVMKCKIPSFVADFVTIDAWVADSGETHMYSRGQSQTDYGKCSGDSHRPLTARSLSSSFPPQAQGRCESPPSFQAAPNPSCLCVLVVAQSYEVEADNEYVIRGNSAVMKCEVPSFVADFVNVEMWVDSAGSSYRPDADYGKGTIVAA